MELDYVLMDPTGNLTALVTSPVPEARQSADALALMAAEPTAEQVGFLSPGGADADVALRMAGELFLVAREETREVLGVPSALTRVR